MSAEELKDADCILLIVYSNLLLNQNEPLIWN